MNEKDWDKRLLDFLKRTGEEIKAETQRLVEEVRDPQTQQKMKESLREFGTWAKETAEEAAEKLEAAIKKAETAFTQRLERPPAAPHTDAPMGAEAGAAPTTSPPSRSVPRGGSPKRVGKGKRAGTDKRRARPSVKTIGRKK